MDGVDATPAAKPAAAKVIKPSNKGGLKPRLSIPLDDAGRANVDVMTDTVRERYERAIGGAARPAAAGVAAGADAPPGWDDEICDFIYDTIAQVAVLVAQRKGYTPEQTQALEFTDKEKSKLRQPTRDVLDKYFPEGFADWRWGKEAMLALALVGVARAKAGALAAVTGAQGAAPAAVAQFPRPATSQSESQ